jgi:hypothetical protein
MVTNLSKERTVFFVAVYFFENKPKTEALINKRFNPLSLLLPLSAGKIKGPRNE